jgi:type II secretory pathway predicted ATPase ExeA
MTGEETTSYIHHHLKLAGRSDPLFSDDAITLIHATSRGLNHPGFCGDSELTRGWSHASTTEVSG